MNQNSKDRQSVPSRSSNSDQGDGPRGEQCETDRMSGSERMRNRESSTQDLGTTSDRAMMTGRNAEGRASEDGGPSSSSSASERSERGMGSSGEQNRESSSSRSRNSGGISNRELDRQQSEQDSLPDRGRSQSER